VPTPGPVGIPGGSGLDGVAVLSSDQAWAVGHVSIEASLQPLILRWDGSSWSATTGPPVQGSLSSVAALAADDVWAVGSRSTASGLRTLIEHFNGKAWTIVRSPDPGGESDALRSVAAVAAGNVWAVGSFRDAVSAPSGRALIEHWNGTRWQVVPAAKAGVADELADVSGGPGLELWAVGHYMSSGGALRTLAELWTGATWVRQDPRNPRAKDELNGVAVTPSIVTAVGDAGPSSGPTRTLAERFCIPCD
jgi:hypothetical protein